MRPVSALSAHPDLPHFHSSGADRTQHVQRPVTEKDTHELLCIQPRGGLNNASKKDLPAFFYSAG